MKILIENTVPFNNGDAALIFSIGEKFESEGCEVYYSVADPNEIREIYPDRKWIKSFLPIKLVKIPFFGILFLSLLILFSKKHREFDAVISAPGGYINSYYSFKRRLQVLYLYKVLLKKKIYMYSQSIGPFNKKDEKIFSKYIKYFTYFYVRDDVSKKRIDKLGEYNNVVQTKDAAFLLKSTTFSTVKSKTIAISVREWKFDERSEDIYFALIKNIVKFFVQKEYKVVFLSTCQGITSYRDDSKIAKKIYRELEEHIQKNVTIDDSFYNLNALRDKLIEFDYVIGTRLHMCILSWLSGTPALNISYEEKGKESYKYLGIPKYSIDYNFEENITDILEEFENRDGFKDVYDRIEKINLESNEHFEEMYNSIYRK